MRIVLAIGLLITMASTPALARDRLLEEAVDFNAMVLYYQYKVPAVVLGAVRGKDIAVSGWGEYRDGSGSPPDGDTLMTIGSITKVFTGAALASLVAEGSVRLTDRLDSHLTWDVDLPEREGQPIRLIHLATHTSGLPREAKTSPEVADQAYFGISREAMEADLASDPLLFTPGTSAAYSNFAFDLLGQALQDSSGQSYFDLLRSRVLEPAGLTSTSYEVPRGRAVMQGHDVEGMPLEEEVLPKIKRGASGLVSSANDLLRWVQWQLDRSSEAEAEMRLLGQAAYVPRDSLEVAYGLDESGHMDAMGLGWVIMRANGERPTILQKAGGASGIFSFVAFAPGHDVGVFVAINTFDFAASQGMAEMALNLLSDLAGY